MKQITVREKHLMKRAKYNAKKRTTLTSVRFVPKTFSSAYIFFSKNPEANYPD